MGDRISISFVNDKYPESVCLFSQYGGRKFLNTVTEFLNVGNDDDHNDEPAAVMVNFLMWLPKEIREYDFLYLGATNADGDNSDNGHFVVNLATNNITEREQ